MQDMRRELSAFFDDRYPGHSRRISSAVQLPNGWVLALSFEHVRDNRGGAYTRYYATRVKGTVVLGAEQARSETHRDRTFPDYRKAQAQIERWYRAFHEEAE